MEGPLFSDTVTVYRGDGTRLVLTDCFYRCWVCQDEAIVGSRQETDFLLILPDGDYTPQIGDRVIRGIGPDHVQWDSFIPVNVTGLGQIAYVKPYYVCGRLHHYEAGRRRYAAT